MCSDSAPSARPTVQHVDADDTVHLRLSASEACMHMRLADGTGGCAS